MAVILEFLQFLLDGDRSHSTFVAAISSPNVWVDYVTVGSHKLVYLFLKGALKLLPPRVQRAPAWDLPLVLDALCQHPFEHLDQVGLKWLSMKTAFLGGGIACPVSEQVMFAVEL